MARPLILPDGFESVDFKALYKQNGTKRYGIRLLAMHYLQSGKGVKETSLLMLKTEFTIREWVKLYASGGIDELLSIRSGRGRAGYLSDLQEQELKLEIDKRSKSLKGGRLRAIDIQKLIEELFGIIYTLSGVYTLLHRLGYSWITSRSIHPKADKVLQEIFKK